MGKRKITPKALTTIYGILLLTVYFLFVGPGGYTNIAMNKYLVLLVLSVGYLLSLIICNRGIRFSVSWFTPARVAILVFAGCSILSTFLSPFWRQAILGGARKEGLITILLYVMLFLTFSTYGFSLKLFAYLSGGSMTIFCLIAFLQLDGRNPFVLYPEGLNYFGAGADYMSEYLGTLGNVDLVAAVMCLLIPFYVCYIILQRKDPWRFFLLLPLLLCIAVTVKMWVLAAFVGLIVGLMLSIPILLGNYRTARNLSIAGIAVLVVGGLMTLRFVDTGSGLFHELHAILNGEISEDFGSQRIAIWKQVWEVIGEQPLWGSGPDTLELWEKGFQGYSAFYQAQVTTLIDTAHNEYLNIWVNQGIFALIAYFAALVYLAWKWIKYAGHHHTNAAICGCAVLCYCVQAFFGMSSCITAPYFWMLLGMLQYEVARPVCDC